MVFDPATWQWEEVNSLLRARAGLGAATCGGRLYALGGEVSSEQRSHTLEAVRDVEFLDECTGQGWVAGPPMVLSSLPWEPSSSFVPMLPQWQLHTSQMRHSFVLYMLFNAEMTACRWAGAGPRARRLRQTPHQKASL